MNPLIKFWDDVIKVTDWDNKSKEDKEEMYDKCGELSAAASEDEKEEFRKHVIEVIKSESND